MDARAPSLDCSIAFSPLFVGFAANTIIFAAAIGMVLWVPHRLRLLTRTRRGLCAQCAYPMETHPYGGPGNVVIDNCPRCRLNWLDFKELNRIVTAPERVFKDESWLPSWLNPLEGEPGEEG